MGFRFRFFERASLQVHAFEHQIKDATEDGLRSLTQQGGALTRRRYISRLRSAFFRFASPNIAQAITDKVQRK
jgi:hypothetical protein